MKIVSAEDVKAVQGKAKICLPRKYKNLLSICEDYLAQALENAPSLTVYDPEMQCNKCKYFLVPGTISGLCGRRTIYHSREYATLAVRSSDDFCKYFERLEESEK
jgi:hypothetical protein